MAELKAQARKLNAPATFARSAKLQRKAIALETTCAKLGTQQASTFNHLIILEHVAFQAFIIANI